MAQVSAISLSQFSSALEKSIKAAILKHPKFQGEPPAGISFDYLIRGYPVPDAVAAKATLAETQAFANEIASQLGNFQGEAPLAAARAAGSSGGGVVYSNGRHILVGIPPAAFLLER